LLPRWFLSLPISYTPNLLFSHSPDHSPSNHSHFCLVTLFSSDCTLDLPLSFNLFRIHPPLIHSFCDHSHPWSPLFLSIFFNSPSSYSLFLWSLALLISPLFFNLFWTPLLLLTLFVILYPFAAIALNYAHLSLIVMLTITFSLSYSYNFLHSCSLLFCLLPYAFSPVIRSQYFRWKLPAIALVMLFFLQNRRCMWVKKRYMATPI